MWRRLRAQTNWTTLASANPVSLCVPMSCEKDKQPTREGHESEAVYIERRSQSGGLGRKEPNIWFWLVIGQ
uniref:Secreted protein n=1 Tax=Mesocestoides corti TaxID=53468 RepID=A0A5K3FE83_MESCO